MKDTIQEITKLTLLEIEECPEVAGTSQAMEGGQASPLPLLRAIDTFLEAKEVV